MHQIHRLRMRQTRRGLGSSLASLPLAALLLAALLVAGCTGGSASPSPDPEPTPPAEALVRLRLSQVQALPPAARFGWMPSIVISLDGRVLTGGAVAAIFPGPLVSPVVERRITDNGWNTVVRLAREAGLLGGVRDFTGGAMPPGSVATRLEIVADGRVHDLVGDANRVMVCVTTPCNPPAGSPEAFGGFVSRLHDLGSALGTDLGAEAMHAPSGYAILVGPPPDDQGLAQPPIAWPFEAGFAGFGKPLRDGSGGRCGTVTGQEATELRPALTAATAITRWRDAADGTFHGLTVRPLLPGDGDPCEGLV
jgi:hypothetical protein